ncbi:MAG: MFS transporter [Bryobacteraceae bacterium]|nr:MFS transporter [Bryobacteraceae bacterium]
MTRSQWLLLALLVVSIFINYVDRGNLSIAAPLLEKELSLTPTELGSLLGAFFWTYALFQLLGIAGWLADRYPVGWVLAWGFIVWSAATAVSGLVSGFVALYAMRLLVGAGESVAYPCYSKILASDFPQEHRGLANALLDAGSKLGPALGTLLGGFLVARLGWRWFFIALGVGSLAWLVPWLIWMPRRHRGGTRAGAAGLPPVTEILSKRQAWGTFFGHFCGNYYWFFLLTWLPLYLVKARGFTLEGMATVGGIAYAVIASATVAAGWISDRWIASGATPTRVRKTIVVTGLAGSTVILPVAVVDDRNVALVLLLLACAAFGTYTSNHWAITQTLAGARAAGRWTSIQNGVGNFSGIVAPWLTGLVVERTGAFYLAFLTAAAIALAGALLWGVAVGRVEEVRWANSSAASPKPS